MPFSDAIAAMMERSNDDTVGLVLRWDEDDSKLWTYYSIQRSPAIPPNITPVPIVQFDRKVWNSDQQLYVPGGQTAVEGFHAEELVLLSWEGLLNQVRLATPNYYPKKVEIVLSKSPCNGRASSAPIDIMYSNGTFQFATSGCASKLAAFIRAQPVEKWAIRYYDLAGAKSYSSDENRMKAGANYMPKLEAVNQQVAQMKENWRDHVPRKQANAPDHVKQQAVNGVADRKLSKFILELV
jgi:hypothetical protein